MKTSWSLVLFLIGHAPAFEFYLADFSTPGVGATHDNAADPLETSPVAGANWSIFWSEAPLTDGTTNRFVTEDGLLVSEDWGGTASFETDEIAVSEVDQVTIEALGTTRGVETFNAASESFQWYYLLDGVRTEGPVITSDGSLDFVAEIDTSGAATLVVGFTFTINGADDGFEISSLRVTDGPVTQPGPEITRFTMDPGDGRGVIEAIELGDRTWVVEGTDDPGNEASWAPVAGGASRQEQADGSTHFVFFESLPLPGRRFYRLVEGN